MLKNKKKTNKLVNLIKKAAAITKKAKKHITTLLALMQLIKTIKTISKKKEIIKILNTLNAIRKNIILKIVIKNKKMY